MPKTTHLKAESLPKANVIVLAPHPEEVVEKCFGAVRGFVRSGSNVSVHVLTTGYRGVRLNAKQIAAVEGATYPDSMARFIKNKIRLREIRAADKVIGTKTQVHQMDFYDSRRVSVRDVSLIQEIIRANFKPGQRNIVIMPDPLDLQPSHKVVYDLAVEAIKRTVRRTGENIESWSFETTYHQHPLTELNLVVEWPKDMKPEWDKALKAHESQRDRRQLDAGGKMSEAARSIAITEELGGFGSDVDMADVKRYDCFSRRVWKPFLRAFVVHTMERQS